MTQVEERLNNIVGTILGLASRNFGVRADVSPAGDLVDAVAAGVNFLGEELEASYRELERKVADRTAALTKATEDLARLALHDDLTGLPNRTLLWDRLSQRLNLAGRRQTGFAVLFLDLDDFKTINDTLGHAAGDRLLVEVAARILGVLRTGDSAARLGGDEFVVLLEDCDSPDAALPIADRLMEALEAPYDLGAGPQLLTVSMGLVAAHHDSYDTADAIVADADAAMYEAKHRGKGRVALHDNGSTRSTQTP
jgi:diguanylate cyclase (GGDEF)-like protein